MARKKRVNPETLGYAALALAGIAAFIAVGKASPGEQPAIFQYGGGGGYPAINFSFPAIDYPSIPGTSNNFFEAASSDSSPPKENTPFTFPDILPKDTKSPADSNIDFSQFFKPNIPNIDLNPFGLLFGSGKGKLDVTDLIYESTIGAGTKELVKQKDNPIAAYAETSAAYGTGSLVKQAGLDFIETKAVGQFAKTASLGAEGIGIPVAGFGIAISAATAASTLNAYQKAPGPGTGAAIGTATGLVSLDVLSATSGITGFAAPTLGTGVIGSLAGGGVVVGAAVAGGIIGNQINQTFKNPGLLNLIFPNSFGPGSVPINVPNLNGNIVQDTKSFKANPGVAITGTATPDITLGDYEANSDNGITITPSSSGSKSKTSVLQTKNAPSPGMSGPLIQSLKYQQFQSSQTNTYKAPSSSVFAGSFGGMFK